jgi:hypothetical protein
MYPSGLVGLEDILAAVRSSREFKEGRMRKEWDCEPWSNCNESGKEENALSADDVRGPKKNTETRRTYSRFQNQIDTVGDGRSLQQGQVRGQS